MESLLKLLCLYLLILHYSHTEINEAELILIKEEPFMRKKERKERITQKG
jgi:hypothetical protein